MDSWQPIQLEEQVIGIKAASYQKPQIIFKHSIRCGISFQIKQRLNKATSELGGKADLYFLDLIRYRKISNLVAETLGVIHQSPQVLLVKNGVVTYHKSHFSIDPGKILEEVKEHQV